MLTRGKHLVDSLSLKGTPGSNRFARDDDSLALIC
jgi:hypothetical protein